MKCSLSVLWLRVSGGGHYHAKSSTALKVAVECRWVPGYEAIEGNEAADEWAKKTAGEPNGERRPAAENEACISLELLEAGTC